MRHHMRAVIVASGAMSEAMTFSTPRGFTWSTRVPSAVQDLPAGDALINRAPAPHVKLTWWGRTMVRVDNVETLDAMAVAQGGPRPLRHGSWGERSLLTDPAGRHAAWSNASHQQQPKSLYSAHRRRAASDNTKRNIVDLRRRMVFGYSYANFLYGSVMV